MRTALLFCTILFTSIATAQSPAWVWAQRAGGVQSDEALANATDASGNVFVAGYFKSANVSFGGTTLTHQAYEDVFLTKYDGAGNALWARAATGIWYDEAFGVAADASGNAIVVGFFSSDTLHFGTTTIASAGSYNGFVAKYSPAGALLWAKAFGGSQQDHCYAVATDADGNIYVTGYFSSTDITFAGNVLVPVQSGDVMLLKYDANGTELWATTATGDQHNEGTCVTTDATGNVIVGGYFYSSSFDVGGTPLTNAGVTDGFLAKYNASGVLQWAHSVGDASAESITGLATDAAGNIGVAGYYESDALTLGSTTLNNTAGGEETLIARYSPAGAVQWAVTGSGGGNQARGIAADANNDFVVSGYYDSDALSFGSIDVSPSVDVMDVFVVKCGATGNFLWATTAGSDGQDQAFGIATDASGSVYVSGWFSGTDITFGSTTLTNDPGSDDLFVAKLNGTTGIAETGSPSITALFPNPAADHVFVVGPAMTNARVQAIDATGKRTPLLWTGAGSIGTERLAPGAYVLEVNDGGVVRRLRFVKE